MLQYDALRDRKAQACSADFSGPGFVHAVEPLIDLIEGLLGDTYAGVLDAHIEIVEIRIDRHSYLAVVPVVLDGVLHQVRDDHGHLDLVDLRDDFTHADHRQLYVSFLRDGPDPAKDQLHHLIDIGLLDAELGVLAVHAHKCEEFRDDLVLAVDLILYIHHKFPVHFYRDIVLLDQGVGQDLHGGHGSLQLVGNIGNKFLPGFIERVHPCQHLVEGVSDMLGLEESRRFDGISGKSRPDR